MEAVILSERSERRIPVSVEAREMRGFFPEFTLSAAEGLRMTRSIMFAEKTSIYDLAMPSFVFETLRFCSGSSLSS
ncbi:MAG: hypothetical protein ACRD3D_15085 [Terriglobia bacterium]